MRAIKSSLGSNALGGNRSITAALYSVMYEASMGEANTTQSVRPPRSAFFVMHGPHQIKSPIEKRGLTQLSKLKGAFNYFLVDAPPQTTQSFFEYKTTPS